MPGWAWSLVGVLAGLLLVWVLLVAGAGVCAISILTRWTFSQLKAIARTTTQAESIRLLLKEYEHRGVGWLWQVDAENRVVYIRRG